MRPGARETEVKLTVPDVAAMRQQLRRQGFRAVSRRSLEQNTLFDTAGGSLRRRGVMLRLRSVRSRHWLTLKGPPRQSPHYKIRQEFETELADARVVAAILAGLGFHPSFRYEKYRTTFSALRRWLGGVVMLDETPIGDFLELEGERVWIRRVARALGASPGAFITKTYADLHADWCRRHGRLVAHMVFPRRRRVALRL